VQEQPAQIVVTVFGQCALHGCDAAWLRPVEANGHVIRATVNQRLKQDTLSSDRKARLDAFGFDWDPQTTLWETGFCHLMTYRHREGHCRVPRDHSENGFALGQWVSNQRPKEKSILLNVDDTGYPWIHLESPARDANKSVIEASEA